MLGRVQNHSQSTIEGVGIEWANEWMGIDLEWYMTILKSTSGCRVKNDLDAHIKSNLWGSIAEVSFLKHFEAVIYQVNVPM